MTQDPQAFDEDEDLFDFPDVAGLQPLAAAEATSEEVETPAEPSVEAAAPAAELPSLEDTPAEPETFAYEDLLLEAVEEEVRQAEAAASAAPANPAPVSAAPAPAAPVAAAPAPAPQPTAAPAPQPVAAAAPTANTLAGLESLIASLPAEQPPQVTVETGGRGRTFEILALCFLVANTALVLFAWRAGDDFRTTLDDMGRGLTEAVSEGQVRAADQVAEQLRASLPVQPVQPQAVVETPVVPHPEFRTIGLELGREALDAGRFEEARRSLARLLANRDRVALSEEDALEARRLIALSYHQQGMAKTREAQ